MAIDLKKQNYEQILGCERTKSLLENIEKLNGITYQQWNDLKHILDYEFEKIVEENDEELKLDKNRESIYSKIISSYWPVMQKK